MGARLRVFLSHQQEETLFALRRADVPQKVKDRAEVVRLNARGWYVEKIAAHFHWSVQTIRETIHRWQKLGMEGLWESKGRGAKARWLEEDMIYIEQVLKQEPRTYNSHQLATKLFHERQVLLSPDRLRRVLKKRGLFGNEPEKAIKGNKINKPET